jgi:hypothetical protein
MLFIPGWFMPWEVPDWFLTPLYVNAAVGVLLAVGLVILDCIANNSEEVAGTVEGDRLAAHLEAVSKEVWGIIAVAVILGSPAVIVFVLWLRQGLKGAK